MKVLPPQPEKEGHYITSENAAHIAVHSIFVPLPWGWRSYCNTCYFLCSEWIYGLKKNSALGQKRNFCKLLWSRQGGSKFWAIKKQKAISSLVARTGSLPLPFSLDVSQLYGPKLSNAFGWARCAAEALRIFTFSFPSLSFLILQQRVCTVWYSASAFQGSQSSLSQSFSFQMPIVSKWYLGMNLCENTGDITRVNAFRVCWLVLCRLSQPWQRVSLFLFLSVFDLPWEPYIALWFVYWWEYQFLIYALLIFHEISIPLGKTKKRNSTGWCDEVQFPLAARTEMTKEEKNQHLSEGTVLLQANYSSPQLMITIGTGLLSLSELSQFYLFFFTFLSKSQWIFPLTLLVWNYLGSLKWWPWDHHKHMPVNKCLNFDHVTMVVLWWL